MYIINNKGYIIQNMKNLPPYLRWGFEWKSRTTAFGLPLIHIAFGLNRNTGKLLIAKGIVSIGIFGIGIVSVTMVGMGVIALGQFSFGIIAIAQFAVGIYFALGQFAAGFVAVGQFACGKYVLAEAGFGEYVFSSAIKDARAIDYLKNIFRIK